MQKRGHKDWVEIVTLFRVDVYLSMPIKYLLNELFRQDSIKFLKNVTAPIEITNKQAKIIYTVRRRI